VPEIAGITTDLELGSDELLELLVNIYNDNLDRGMYFMGKADKIRDYVRTKFGVDIANDRNVN